MHGNGALTAVRTSLSEQLAGLRGVAVSDLPASLLAVAVRDVAGIHLLLPADWEALRHDEGAAGRPVPFWARPWPSGNALAEAIAADPPAAGARVLELGCGLAAPSIVAARAGATVLATDGATDAVAFAAHSLALNQTTGDVAHVAWAEHGDELADRGPFDLVLAADVCLHGRERRRAGAPAPRGSSPRAATSGSPTPAATTPAASSPPPARASSMTPARRARSRCTSCARADPRARVLEGVVEPGRDDADLRLEVGDPARQRLAGPELRKAVGREHLRVHGVERRRGTVDLAQQLLMARLEPGHRPALLLRGGGRQGVLGEEPVHPVGPCGVALDERHERVDLAGHVVQGELRFPHRLLDRVRRGVRAPDPLRDEGRARLGDGSGGRTGRARVRAPAAADTVGLVLVEEGDERESQPADQRHRDEQARAEQARSDDDERPGRGCSAAS